MNFNDNKNIGFDIFTDAQLLGEHWDRIAGDNVFLKRSSLLHLQKTNPCDQRYYINEKEKIIFVSYRLRLNIFTLTRGLDIKLPVTIIGIPCSISYRGYSYIKDEDAGVREIDILSGSLRTSSADRSLKVNVDSSKVNIDSSSDRAKILEEGIESLKGIKLVLNADDDLSFSKGHTLPQYILDIRWKSFDEYLASMRSHYRYRMKKALLSATAITTRILKTETEKKNEDEIHLKNANSGRITENGMLYMNEPEEDNNCSFSLEMYKLYEEVYENSKDKLEKLSIDFFRTFPSTIITFYIEDGEDNIPAGFIQIKENHCAGNNINNSSTPIRWVNDAKTNGDDHRMKGNELIFMFAGLNHALNLKYDIYLNMLLYMIRYAIENGYKSIDLGQTTMDSKLKLGAVSRPKYMYLTSDKPFLRQIMPLAARFLSYKETQKELHVFKDRKVII